MVRLDPAVEWSPIEESVFEEAFGASNPYNNPEFAAPKTSSWWRQFLWLVAGAACVIALKAAWVLNHESDPAKAGQITGEFAGQLLGSLAIWGVIRSVWGLVRPKKQ
jgi:hypothetical protein